jgi:hypothetical protein
MLGSIAKFTAIAFTGALATVITMNWCDSGTLDDIKREIEDKQALLKNDETLTEAQAASMLIEYLTIMRPEWRKRFILQINSLDLDSLLALYLV